jgi:hypothetical protein
VFGVVVVNPQFTVPDVAPEIVAPVAPDKVNGPLFVTLSSFNQVLDALHHHWF